MNQDSYIALKRSEMEFRALSEQAAIGVTKTETATGKYVFVNQRFADIVGYTRDELLTMSFHVLTDPADLAEDLDNLGRLVKGDLHEYSMEKRYRRKDGMTMGEPHSLPAVAGGGVSPVRHRCRRGHYRPKAGRGRIARK